MNRIFSAPFGRHTRYMLAGYLRHVFIVTSILLAIALTIDLWPQFQDVAEAGGPSALGGVWSVVRFAALRTPGLVAPFLPFATFIGVLWTEVVHTQSGERMLVWNSGRSPAQCLAPVLILGVVLGGLEFAMDGWLGPASMGVQMQERLGRDGQRLDRGRIGRPSWIAISGGLLRMQIQFGPPPVLHNVTFFKRDNSGRLQEVVTAAAAHRVPGTDRWRLEKGEFWTTSQATARRGDRMIPFASRTMSFTLDPVGLSYFGMESQYLSLPVLHHMSRIEAVGQPAGYYKTRLHVVYAEPLLPGSMALLASSLAMLLLAYGTPVNAVVAIAFAGYFAHFATKACLLLGQNGYIPPAVAGWAVPLSLLTIVLLVMGVIALRRRRSARAVH